MTDTPSGTPPTGGSYTPPPPPPPPPPTSDVPPPPPTAGGSSDRTLMLVLSYIFLIQLVPLLTKKDDPEVQWHAKNGTALSAGFIGIMIVFWIINFVLPSPVACAVGLVSCLIPVAFVVLSIIGIIQALNGKRFRMPVVSDIAEKINL